MRKQLRCSWELCQHLPHPLGLSPTWTEHTCILSLYLCPVCRPGGKVGEKPAVSFVSKDLQWSTKEPQVWMFCCTVFPSKQEVEDEHPEGDRQLPAWMSQGIKVSSSLQKPACNTSLVDLCQGFRLRFFCCHYRWRSQNLGEALGRGVSSETCTAITAETGNIPSAFQYLFLFNLPALLTSLCWRGN